MRIDSAGNVGIGTDAPATSLQVGGTSGSNFITLSGASTNGEYGINWAFNQPGTNIYSQVKHNWNDRDTKGLQFNTQAGYRFSFNTINSTGTFQSNLVTVLGSGNVGIGTDAPTSKLHINSNSNSAYTSGFRDGELRIANDNSSNVAYQTSNIVLSASGWAGVTTGVAQLSVIQDGSNLSNGTFTIKVRDNGTHFEAFRIKHNGNVGIGTTDPAYKLDVSGNLRINEGNTFTDLDIKSDRASGNIGGINFINSADALKGQVYGHTDGSVKIASGGSSVALTILSSGNVGIGTTDPAILLTLNESTNNTSLGFYNDGTDAANRNWIIGSNDQVFGDFLIKTSTAIGGNPISAGVARLYINPSGSVGIGTTNPGAKLDVRDGALFVGDYTGTATPTDGIWMERPAGNSNQIQMYTTGASIFGISSTGTSASIGWSSGQPRTVNFVNTGAGTIRVGIGTDSPVATLDVNGDIRIGDGVVLSESTDRANLLHIKSETSGWGGLQVSNSSNEFIFSLMGDGSNGGIYDDQNGDWLLYWTENASVILNYNASNKLATHTNGIEITNGSLGVGVTPNSTDGRIDASNDIVAFQTSDRRLKENITPITNALEKVRSLTGVMFDWKEETKSVHGYEGHDVGIIAQDVQAVLPEAVRTNDTGYLSVRYEKMIALLIEANKELATRVEELESKLK